MGRKFEIRAIAQNGPIGHAPGSRRRFILLSMKFRYIVGTEKTQSDAFAKLRYLPTYKRPFLCTRTVSQSVKVRKQNISYYYDRIFNHCQNNIKIL